MPLVELGRYQRIAAHIVVGRLESEGLFALCFDGEASIGDGSWLLIPTRVMVDAGDLARARAIVEAVPEPDWPAPPDHAAP